MKKTVFLVWLVLTVSCGQDGTTNSINRNLINDEQLLSRVVSGDFKSDPFTIQAIKRSLTQVELEVQYGGGCEEHDFQLVWDGEFKTEDGRKLANVALLHDANGDQCEALITQNLTFNFSEIFGEQLPSEGFDLHFFHGGTSEGYFMAEETIKITQGMQCVLNATFEDVVCGLGFFDNSWFLSNDDLLEDHDKFYYQPAEYDLDDVPEYGDYRMGIRILKDYDPQGIVCFAYSGYPIPVKINSLCPVD